MNFASHSTICIVVPGCFLSLSAHCCSSFYEPLNFNSMWLKTCYPLLHRINFHKLFRLLVLSKHKCLNLGFGGYPHFFRNFKEAFTAYLNLRIILANANSFFYS